MSVDPRLIGVHSALVTPLHEDGQTVDADGLRRVIDFVLAGGCTGVVVLGGTGEYTALSFAERERAVAAAAEHVDGRAPVTVGIVAPGLGDAREMARLAARRGADYVMPITPYYARGGQEGVFGWYMALAETSELPIVLYNIPSRTGVNLEPATVGRLADASPRFVGIKECNTDLGNFSTLVEAVGDRLCILSGEDYYAVPELALGAHGALLASSNVVPRQWMEIFHAVRTGDVAAATAGYRAIFPLVRAIFAEMNPGPLKAAMRLMGLPVGPVALPLTEPSATTMRQLEEALAQAGVALPAASSA
ncbi:MAG: 4-hydroxy-tetrahydrodipicolinate synthase [Thermomicrobiales bacterium]|nr:4-hydroxy-tetrahydrodipicolinate synthase [Thermomicrobiales bacterium]